MRKLIYLLRRVFFKASVIRWRDWSVEKPQMIDDGDRMISDAFLAVIKSNRNPQHRHTSIFHLHNGVVCWHGNGKPMDADWFSVVAWSEVPCPAFV